MRNFAFCTLKAFSQYIRKVCSLLVLVRSLVSSCLGGSSLVVVVKISRCIGSDCQAFPPVSFIVVEDRTHRYDAVGIKLPDSFVINQFHMFNTANVSHIGVMIEIAEI